MISVVGVCLICSDRFYHWFIVPVLLCGILTASDGIEWLRGRIDLYDPVGIIGIAGVHFFFLAPLLHVKWDLWMGSVAPPPDWRDWLGYMAVFNVGGLLMYRLSRSVATFLPIPSESVTWQISPAKTQSIGFILTAIATIAQICVYREFGGIEGYMDTRLAAPAAFEGMGWVFMISESAPLLALFMLVSYLNGRRVSWSIIVSATLVMFGLQLIFGGLRGSRSETVSALFWFVGCVHFLIRPVAKRLLLTGSMFILAFLYFYGFYKAVGKTAAEVVFDSEQRAQISQRTGRSFEAVLVGDLARADVQAFTLYRLWDDNFKFTYARGRTYLGSLSLLIPRFLLPGRPETKLKEGTEIETGAGSYIPSAWSTSRVFGLAGEAMLNFGPFAAPLAYIVFGLVVGLFRVGVRRFPPGDARFLLVPFGVYLSVTLLAGDSDNVVFGMIKDGFMPFLFVVLCSERQRCRVTYARLCYN
jgi:hypothetical protein